LKIFKESIMNDNTEWVVKFEDKKEWRTLSFKPLFVHAFAKELLFSFCDKVLIMSATILNKKIFCSSLGIDMDDCFYHVIDNQFPVENRRITFSPSGSMAYKNKPETMPKMIDDVSRICEKHSEERGIIHTNSFDISEKLLDNCSRSVRNRFFFQKNFSDKEDMLREHSKCPNGILIGPALHIGLDLKDDLSRFQIICKVPYPSFADNPQLKKRMDISNEYYMFLTAMKLVQSIGRSVRSETDWAKTYVLDSDFKSFCARSKGILPNWFLKSIVW
jgi:ATP-dependent DNA helicase DinG